MPSQLLTLFQAAEQAFNNAPATGDYNNLAEYLHHSVTMKRVDDPSSVMGIANVIFYLNSTQVVRAPRLVAGTFAEWPANTDLEIRATIIRGTGTYRDNSVPYNDVTNTPVPVSTPINVHYIFSFVRKTIKDKWQIINAIATPT
jgi:hypothetical protein